MPAIDSVGVAAILLVMERYVGRGELYANAQDTRNARAELERFHAVADLIRAEVIDRGGIVIARQIKYDGLMSRAVALRRFVLVQEKNAGLFPTVEDDPLALDAESGVANG